MTQDRSEKKWRDMLSGAIPFYRRYRRVLGVIPSRHRCKNCNAPFEGLGGLVMRIFAHGPYNKNPRFCNW